MPLAYKFIDGEMIKFKTASTSRAAHLEPDNEQIRKIVEQKCYKKSQDPFLKEIYNKIPFKK
ncbi:hypothetical protein CR205_16755 [Alteribacter lacisalsi]|uniref:Uncharacterized protein n=1 Tax=Alteribacter lacisalsi TaxID=2045244 RepID=A0A2W0H4S3_9BACI|nr:hypothetical protein CR205_16755 [Alteribacter lacisalsi]